MFGDSSINSVGGDAGKLFPDGRRTVTHNPLFFFEKRGDNESVDLNQEQLPFHVLIVVIFSLKCYNFIVLNRKKGK